MRKLVNLFCFLFLGCVFLFAQNDYSTSANRATAIRCLKLSENYFMSGDWDNSLRQAKLGLAYDDSISDLIYLKSAAEARLNKPKADIIKSIESAFEKDQWVSYTKNCARILYADLLSDTRQFEESMDVLDQEPLIFSADAEFIRIKNLYRMGTEQSINAARDKVNVSSRIYSKDSRFPDVFFMFELMFLNNAERKGIKYDIPKSVQDIANVYIKRIPNYVGEKQSIEIMATFFAQESDKKRLINAIDSKEQYKNSLLAYAGLKTGIYTEQQAFDMFFDSADDFIHLGLLENFAINIEEEGVKKRFAEKLLNYNGFLLIDNNYDLQAEIAVQYKVGRPYFITYDENNDDNIDISASCNFGVPGAINFSQNNTNLTYSVYPDVATVSYENKDFIFNFYGDDFKIEPLKFMPSNIFTKFGIEFFIPEVNKDQYIPDCNELKLMANAVSIPTEERADSNVIYTTHKGNAIYADFYDNGVRYAFCDLSVGFPFTRNVDQDNDGVFETNEIYNVTENPEEYITEEEITIIGNIFNPVVFDNNLYLSKIEIDRNRNTFFEFTEEYLGLGGRITTWDNDDNGIIDSRYKKYPRADGEELKEDSVFFSTTGEPYISINFLGGVPVKMDYKSSEVIVFAGQNKDFYWIEEEGSSENEDLVVKNVVPQLSNGITKIVQLDNMRVAVIKVNDKVFCKIIPLD